ncbi:hypothetical protein K458DRAFT_25026 [Lentithecium fluviatile CBS 122367]|uniref:Uncharacterized protein n=1 Tax=Lentithecium fluviatile CBS 122367 TaxID=1168545 RepID=A0A6G1J4L2_9PLEO|nr:hypothetical protein K458DRAFT_25026 [Lentithecium fluviatile CBS 122367]
MVKRESCCNSLILMNSVRFCSANVRAMMTSSRRQSEDRNYTRERLSNEDFADMLVIAHSEYSKAVRVGAIRESCEEELIQVMKRRCPNFHEKVLERVVREWTRRVKKSQDSSKPQPQTTMPQNRAAASKPASMAVNQDLTTWVYEQYLNFGFNKGGFKGFAHLSQRCQNLKPHQRREIIEVISK